MGKVDAVAPANKPSDYCEYAEEQQWWTSDPEGEHKLQSAKTGIASYKEGVPLVTIPQVFDAVVSANGNRPALVSELSPPIAKGQEPPESKPIKQWATWTWQAYRDDARKFAKAAIASGLAPHESVAILGFNSPQWAIALFGAMFAGGKGAGIYPSDNVDSVTYKTDHSNSVVAAVQGQAELDKYKEAADKLPKLTTVVTWECEAGEDFTTADGRVIKTFNFQDFLAMGAEQKDDDLNERLENIKPGHACVLVYTSGTTGKPKAVMLCHDNLTFTGSAAMKEAKFGLSAKEDNRVLSYLPLCHVAGLMLDLIGPMMIASNLASKGTSCTYFARPYDLKRGSLVKRLQAVRPTMFLGVPRVWEKIMEKLKAIGASTKGFKKKLSTFAKSKATRYTSSRQLGMTKDNPRTMKLANMVLGQIKKKLGLDKARFYISGAAPLARDVLEYFGSLNITINELYGMSETTAAGTFSSNEHHVWGSVGYELSGAEVRILVKDTVEEVPRSKDLFHADEGEQGEICFRGRNVMMGYMANPRLGDEHMATIQEKNEGSVDKNGWVRSGDKGTRDTRGMYKITGRYKELIIGAGGENVAPVPIEDALKAACPFLSNVMMIGNKRKFNVMVVTLQAVGATGEFPGTNILDGEAKTLSTARTIEEAMEDPVFEQKITEAITAINNNKEVVPSNAAKVQKYTILPRDFSVVTGELTATLKVKRSIVEETFDPIVSKMFEVEDVYVKYSLAPTPDLAMGDTPEAAPERSLSLNMVKTVADAEKALAEDEAKAE